MITFKTGNLLESQSQALVNTVNTVGVMGKGIALQMKNAFPDNTKAYNKAVKEGKMKLGEMLVVPVSSSINGPEFIINFPTKSHWRFPSQLPWIREGLTDLRDKLLKYGITSVALPPLGCGNGGLNWNDVKPEIENALKDLPIEIVVYEPAEEIKALLKKQEKESASKLTPARAMLLQLLFSYRALGEFAAEKLSYFLQRFGENQLKLRFKKGIYGPYSGQVRHVLYAMNGYYLKGYEQKDAKPFDELQLMVQQAPKVKEFIEETLSSEDKDRLDKVSNLIEGFQSPYGLELLATVDYLIQETESFDLNRIKESLNEWSERKNLIFTEQHLQLAITHLKTYPFLYQLN